AKAMKQKGERWSGLLAEIADFCEAAADGVLAVVDPRDPANRQREFAAVGELKVDALRVKERRGMEDADPAARDVPRQHVAHLERLVFASLGRMDRRDRQHAEIVAAKLAILGQA